MNKLVVFRTDANSKIGTGHLFRCVILARELQKHDADVIFICWSLPEKIAKGPLLQGFKLHNLESDGLEELDKVIEGLGQACDDRILIIDSDVPELYDTSWQRSVKDRNWKLMYFSFYHEYRFLADIVLNQNIRAPELNYQCESYTKLLLGTEYVILKEDFKNLSADVLPEDLRQRNRCLLFFGGADLQRVTLKVLRALLNGQALFEKLVLVIGALNPDKSVIEELAMRHSESVDLYINTPKMPELMAQCGYAITSGGLTAWELATLKVFQMVIPSSERERITAEYCAEKGWVHLWQGELGEEKLHSWVAEFKDSNRKTEAAEDFFNKVAVNGTEKVVREIMNLFPVK